MKTIFFLITLLATASTISASAQTLLENGMAWRCAEHPYSSDATVMDKQYIITVCGDTIVGETVCKKLSKVYPESLREPIFFAALEKDNHVYVVNEDGKEKFLNFDLTVGDADGVEGIVTAIDSVTVNGISRKRITINRNGHLQYLVEGIGLSDDWKRYQVRDFYYNILLSVELNGVTIFTAKEFDVGTMTVEQTKNPVSQGAHSTYDLSGKRVRNGSHGIIIIRDDRKIILR